MKHTKGEWLACCLHDKPHFVFANDSEITICSIFQKQDFGFNLPIEEVQANAKLIAAAPELLDAIKYYFDVLEEVRGKDWNKSPDHVLSKMINAINKATL